jgi:hypothetical protein
VYPKFGAKIRLGSKNMVGIVSKKKNPARGGILKILCGLIN